MFVISEENIFKNGEKTFLLTIYIFPMAIIQLNHLFVILHFYVSNSNSMQLFWCVKYCIWKVYMPTNIHLYLALWTIDTFYFCPVIGLNCPSFSDYLSPIGRRCRFHCRRHSEPWKPITQKNAQQWHILRKLYILNNKKKLLKDLWSFQFLYFPTFKLFINTTLHVHLQTDNFFRRNLFKSYSTVLI